MLCNLLLIKLSISATIIPFYYLLRPIKDLPLFLGPNKQTLFDLMEFNYLWLTYLKSAPFLYINYQKFGNVLFTQFLFYINILILSPNLFFTFKAAKVDAIAIR